MKRLWTSLVLAVALACSGEAAAQDCPSSGGQTRSETYNGQTFEMIASGISASVVFIEISSWKIAGVVTRTSGGPSEGCVTIHWVNKQMTVVLHLSAEVPEARFEIATTPVLTKTLSQIKSLFR